jgi:hypothetical protein
MKILRWTSLCALATGVLFLLPSNAAQGGDDPLPGLEERVAALETALETERAAHADTRALLELTLDYLDAQAKGAGALMLTLDAAEQAGFTAGINFRSREILLEGWRAYWGGQQQGLPERKPKPKPVAPPAR